MSNATDNPYAAPQAELSASELPPAQPWSRQAAGPSIALWTVFFLFNLPVATGLGLMSCNRGTAGLGMVPAIVAFYAVTLALYRYSGRFAGYWVAGSGCVAVSQIYPVLHIMLGGFATHLFGPPLSFSEAAICSLIVGGGLIAVSLVLGGLFYGIWLFTTRDQRGNRYE